MKELFQNPWIWIALIILSSIATYMITVGRYEKKHGMNKKHHKNPPLTEEDMAFINKNGEFTRYPENEAKLNNLLTEEDEKLINNYYKENPELKP